MKGIKIFLLIQLLRIYSLSQQWPETDAEWTYCVGDPIWPLWTADTLKLYYTRDTVIGSVTYNVTENELNSPNEWYRYYTRYSNDAVYRWVNDTEYLFFHFQLHLDEVITTFRSIAGTSDTSCSSLLPLKVVDSSTVVISGQSLTRWKLVDTLGFDPYSTGSPIYEDYWLYEKLGFGDYPWFYSAWEQIDCEMISDIGYGYLDGYVDETFPEWVADCPMASVEENANSEVQLFPNPASFEIFISGEAETYKIHYLSGGLVQKGIVPETGLINIASLSLGIYLIEVVTSEARIAQFVLIKE